MVCTRAKLSVFSAESFFSAFSAVQGLELLITRNEQKAGNNTLGKGQHYSLSVVVIPSAPQRGGYDGNHMATGMQSKNIALHISFCLNRLFLFQLDNVLITTVT